jgi:hypothetical protein
MYSTSGVHIERADFEPDHYFELTEEDLNKHPALREALGEMKKQEKEYMVYRVPMKEGNALFEYLNQRQKGVGYPNARIGYPFNIYFKYGGDLYGFGLMV